MAKKKKEEAPAPGSPAWMATFGDLMNLLLCLFVLLFSMSEIKADKFQEVVNSIKSSFSLMPSGGSALDQGILISSGVSQLNELSEYYSNMGKATEGEGSEVEGGTSSDPIDEFYELVKATTSELENEVNDEVTQSNLDSYVEVSVDKNFNYVQISLSGTLLFDSGEAEIKEQAKPILSKVGDILRVYKGYQIKIEGHTDTVPQVGGKYKDNLWLSSARANTVYEYLRTVKSIDPAMMEATGRGEYFPIASNKTEEGRKKNRRVEIKIYNKLLEE